MYAYAALRALVAWKPARFEIELDPPGEARVFTAYSVGCANSRAYGGGMRIVTTLNAKLQNIAQSAVTDTIASLAYRRVSQGALRPGRPDASHR